MEYRVLGSLEVRSDGHVAALGPPKQRALLAILLLHAGEIVPTDRLIELLWGEHPPRTAAHSIQIYVSALRQALERVGAGQAIVTTPPGYVFEVDAESIDAHRFEHLVSEGTEELEGGDPAAAADAIGKALGLWRGPPLSDFPYEEFAQDEIRRLDGLHLQALEELGAAELARGRAQAALSAIDAAIALDPLRERSRELRMLALYRAGRQPEALRTFHRFRALLREELGVDPSPSLERLHERMLLHDPTLAPAPLPEPVSAPGPVRNPYKGLRAFGEEDADDFFGREALVAQLVAAVVGGIRLLALVGPSGSGKSSVIHAGLIPALRTARPPALGHWTIARMVPGERPFDELAVALERTTPAAPPASSPELDGGDDGLRRAAERILPAGGRLLLVIDQFEQLFSSSDEPARPRFLRNLTTAAADPAGRVTIALAIRADFYDRPLLEPGFAPFFTRGVVNVLPMTADGLESAVVRPARRVGVDVDRPLLAQLMADMADQPGALPLLQYTLTELFDRRAGTLLTLEGYRALGGLHGVLSRRAEEAYAQLDEGGRRVALQVFLRLVRPGDGATHARRGVPLHELTSAELDPVALSDVLRVFGHHRLLSFDRDPTSDAATVEVAHEALLGEWERLAGWIDRHRADLRQCAALSAAAVEWEASGRNPDYVLIGSRLAEYEAWTSQTVLRLTASEREFLDAGIARRLAGEAEEAARRERQRRLERRATSRLWALYGAIALLAAGITFGVASWLGSGPPDAVLLFEGTGDVGFGDMAADGFDRGVGESGLKAETRVAMSGSREVELELRRISQRGVGLVVVGIGAFSQEPTVAVAAEYPGTRFVVWENRGDLPPNVTNLTFRSAEGSYLAGVVAARTSRTGIIGFIGAFRDQVVDAYLAGYEAGAKSVDRDVDVRHRYLTVLPDFSGASSPELGAREATNLYADGADVIFGVAGGSNLGLFQVATHASEEQRRQLWAIGVDTDEYRSVLSPEVLVSEGEDPGAWQRHILTSVTKRLDRALEAVIGDYARGDLASGERSFGLAEGGVEISDSGGFIDDLRPELEVLRTRITSGEIVVPKEPSGAVETQAP